MYEKTPTVMSFNEQLLLQQELSDYGNTVNAVGLLQVTDCETGAILEERDGIPWFLIEYVTEDKFFVDTRDNFFNRNDERYSYQWIAYRQ